MTMTEPAALIAADRLYAFGSIERSRARIASALAQGCEEHSADAGEYCWGSARSAVRGFCARRYERGAVAALRRAAEPHAPYASRASVTRLDFRHPNRHPMTPIKTGAAR